MSKINDLNTRLASYVREAEDIKEKIKDIAVTKNILIEGGVDTPLDVLNKIDNIPTKTSSDMIINGATVTAPAGYYPSEGTKTISSGSVTVSGSVSSVDPSISLNPSTGVITASVSETLDLTPTVTTPGYITTGTQGQVSLSGENTYSLTTLSGTTYTPGTIDQTITAGQYLTGNQLILGDANLQSSNIVNGVTIFGVTGNASTGTDVSDTTAAVSDVREGVYFYTSAGVRTEGTIQSYTESSSVTPTTSSQTLLTAGKYTINNITVEAIPSEYKDVTGTNAQSSDILAGKTAISTNGDLTGTIQSKAAATYTPGTTNQIITAGQYLSGDQTIEGDANLQENNIVNGVTIFGVTGNAIVANLQTKTTLITPSTQVSTTTITPDSGYNGMSNLEVTVNVPTASVTVSGSATINPIISINSSTGEITATNLNEGSPTVLDNISPLVNTNGYVTQNDVMAGSIALSGTSTLQLATVSAATITPTTSDQTIPADTYLTGAQTIKGDSNLVSENIISGTIIFGVQGSATVPTGTINITQNGSSIDVSNYATANVSVQPVLESTSETITTNGTTTTITPSSGYDGISQIEITTAIPTYDSEGQVTITNNGSIAAAGMYFENDIIVDVSSGGLNINGEIIQATVESGYYVSQGDFVSLISENPYTVREYNSLTDMGLKYGVALQSGSDSSIITVSIPYTNYTVDNNLGNCTTSNYSTTVRKNSNYSATITPDSGYSLENAAVTIRMGGVDITSTAYSNGNISIATINGDLTITVVCGNYNSLLDSNDDILTDSNEDELIFIDNS